jgi:hypothetical protein
MYYRGIQSHKYKLGLVMMLRDSRDDRIREAELEVKK